MQAWPIEEILGRPIASLALAAALPFATAKLLRLVLLGSLPADPAERAQKLFPLRQASFLVGLAQIQLAWTAGATALGPGLLAERSNLVEGAFGALCALTAFVAGGIARRAEAPADDRPSARSAAILRLRIAPLFAGPLIAAMAALELPLASWTGAAWAIRWEWVVVAFAICAAGAAYAGLALAVLTTALRPATAQVRRRAPVTIGIAILAWSFASAEASGAAPAVSLARASARSSIRRARQRTPSSATSASAVLAIASGMATGSSVVSAKGAKIASAKIASVAAPRRPSAT